MEKNRKIRSSDSSKEVRQEYLNMPNFNRFVAEIKAQRAQERKEVKKNA